MTTRQTEDERVPGRVLPRRRGERLFLTAVLIAVMTAFRPGVQPVLAAQVSAQTQESTAAETLPESDVMDVSAAETASVGNVWQKLSQGLDVSILIIGDSIGLGAGTDNSDGGLWQWFYQLAGYLTERFYTDSPYHGTITLTNISVGASDSYAGYVRTMTLDDGIDYDLAIVCCGQNDPEGDIALYYEALLRAVWQRYPDCGVIAVLEASQQDYTERIRTIQKLCAHYGIPTADALAAFSASGFTVGELTVDGIHPNNAGQTLYYIAVASVMEEQIAAVLEPGYGETDIAGERVQAVDAVTDAALLFDEFIWYPAAGQESGITVEIQAPETENAWGMSISIRTSAEERAAEDTAGGGACADADGADMRFVRIDEVTWALAASGSGILGIEYDYEPGDVQPQIYIDNVLCEDSRLACDFDFPYAQHRLQVVLEDCGIQTGIVVTFGTKEQADGFSGMCLSS